jgi:trehalose 6-phosphate synthase/phosphatase
MSRTIIVSNRLPVRSQVVDGDVTFKATAGGLATGLKSVLKPGEQIWIGWPGSFVEDDAEAEQIRDKLVAMDFDAVFLTADEIEKYYEGFSNGILWPICHYVPSYATYVQEFWDGYVETNRKFANRVLERAKPGDTIWVHDYQLLLVPQMVREQLPDVNIGYFHHIPFPSYEIFRQIPWREELLTGMLGADLVGFHTYDDVRHFISSVTRVLGLSSSLNQVDVDQRPVLVDAFPMSIDFRKYEKLTTRAGVRRNVEKVEQSVRGARMIFSVDRLDYSKGILERLQAYEHFLQEHPEYQEKVSLLMLVVPSRDRVPAYRRLKREIDRTVSNINAHYGTLGWQPVWYMYRSVAAEMLSAMYVAADVCLVTPLRDGMNLVSKEYVASSTDDQGVLILSEMAGASKELTEAIIINPNDVPGLASALYRALEMPQEEQRERMRSMRATVRKFNVQHWVMLFMQRLREIKQIQRDMWTKRLTVGTFGPMRRLYGEAGKRMLFLDYDGTLMGFNVDPLKVQPDAELLRLLETLADDPRNNVAIISGRKHETLDEWLGHLPIDLIAEHGAWTRRKGEAWQKHPGLSNAWKNELRPILESFADRTPGSLVEEKSYSLSWHYRKVEQGLGEQRSIELQNALRSPAFDLGLQTLQGHKVIEIKSNLVSKGNAARVWLEEDDYDFVLAAGDDQTDEDTFKAMPSDAVTIKVGGDVSAARYSTDSWVEMRALLQELVEESRSELTAA